VRAASSDHTASAVAFDRRRAEPRRAAAPTYPITSVDNALRLLLLFREQHVLRLSAISERLHVAPSTAHRLLAMLQYRGFVRQDSASRAYVAGPSLMDASYAVTGSADLCGLVHPILEQLMDATGETTHLMVLIDRGAMFLDAAESDAPVHTAPRIGIVLPAHCTSGGKALLAQMSDERVRELYADHPPERLTGRSINGVKALLRELRLIRHQGYAINVGESDPDVAAASVAFRTDDGVSGALVVSAPRRRLDEHVLPEVVEQLHRAVTGVRAAALIL
jgi:IclR family acetate operon transcriptional repressor